MYYIFVYFEMNPVSKDEKEFKEKCPSEIIEIGAIILDDKYNEISTFKRYVKPEHNDSISKKCEELTGISNQTLEESKTFSYVLAEFLNWCIYNAGRNSYEVYAWSENDLDQIKNEISAKNIAINTEIKWMLNNWKDYQRKFCDLIGLKNPISLAKAIEAINIDFRGQAHDALYDAINTAEIFRAVHNKKKYDSTIKKIIEVLKPCETMSYNLEEIINKDFS